MTLLTRVQVSATMVLSEEHLAVAQKAEEADDVWRRRSIAAIARIRAMVEANNTNQAWQEMCTSELEQVHAHMHARRRNFREKRGSAVIQQVAQCSPDIEW